MPPVRSALTATGVVVALGAAVSVAPSFGANARLFDLTTNNDSSAKTKGSAHAYGSVEFDRRETALIQGHINDLCPKDGNGAYLEIHLTFGPKGSVAGQHQDGGVVRDLSTCKENGVDFKLRTKGYGGKRINGVHLYLKECNATAQGRACNGDGGVSGWYVNIDRDPR